MKYYFQIIMDPSAPNGRHFRIADKDDNRIATCYAAQNAEVVVNALNAISEPMLWTCGHIATSCCAECYRELADKARELAEQLDAGDRPQQET